MEESQTPGVARPSLSLPARERTCIRMLGETRALRGRRPVPGWWAKPKPLRLSPESVRGRTRGVFWREEGAVKGSRPAIDPSTHGDRGLVPSLLDAA